MTPPTTQQLQDLQRVVDAFDGKAAEGYTAEPLVAAEILRMNAVQNARWVLALSSKVDDATQREEKDQEEPSPEHT